MRHLALACLSVASLLVACASPSSHDDAALQSASETANAKACTDANKAQLVAQMLTQPITPPRHGAGLDLAGDDAWSGLSKATVESRYCAGIADGADDPSQPNALSYFIWGSDGNSYPVEAGFDASGKLGFIEFNRGYTGGVDFKSRDGQHTYSLRIGQPIRKDGQPLAIDWADTASYQASATELTDALVASFAPDLPAIEGNCVTAHRCLAVEMPKTENDDGGILVGARDVSFYVHLPAANVTASGPSTPDYFYLFPKPAHLSTSPAPSP